ncbi:hypothetical protein CA603_10540 [Paraburkholderia hospita]|nr:hypothetical protein CA603_10540 [Paraburkholderia hospita]
MDDAPCRGPPTGYNRSLVAGAAQALRCHRIGGLRMLSAARRFRCVSLCQSDNPSCNTPNLRRTAK